MSGFIFIAGLLTLATLAALLYPLLRKRDGEPEAWRSGGIAGLVILLGSAALYPLWSNYKWHEAEPALDSPEAMVGRLARRLEKQPDDLAGWLMLGRSYGVIGQHELAARAYQRADTMAQGKSAEALEGLGEALLESGRSDLAGRAGRVFEQAMELEGGTVKSLFYAAFAALERNELPLSRERFERLLAANPPAALVQLIDEQLTEIDALERLGAQAGEGGAATLAAQGEAAAPVRIALRVTLAPSVAGNASAGAPLFVSARIPGQRMPLAAKRLEATFPQEVELLSTDGMMPGAASFTAGQQLEIEARIANGGSANSRSGDPFGTILVTAGEERRLAVEISQLKP